MDYKGKKIAILGYGLEGVDAEKYFLERGIKPVILDQKDGDEYLNDLNHFDVIVRSPGVYRYKKEIVEVEKNGVIITSPIKIFLENCKAKIIGVTGTKGKGTTSTLIYEILKSAGNDVYLAGNIGKPFLSLLKSLSSDSFVILEMSSFQLIDLDMSPYISVVLNITSDHMDWHKDQDEYVNAKKNIVKFQSASDYAVINFDYDIPKSFASLTKGKVIAFTRGGLDLKFKENLLLRGEHNLENIGAAVSVGQVLNISDDIVIKAVQNFKGLEHRLELVDTINGITFYNDSFATGPLASIAAINSFTEPETLILGGSDKGLNYEELGKSIDEKENVKNVILIGTTGPKIYKYIKNNLKLKIKNLKFATMTEIVNTAFKITNPGGVVILSPASASFDMFLNYKDRGNQFKKCVEELKNV